MDRNRFYLYREVGEMAFQTGSLYRDIRPCRDDLAGFMEANGWFGLEFFGSGDDIYFEDGTVLRAPLSLWLRAYRKPGEERMDILCDAYRDAFPDTCRHFSKYLRENGIYGKEGGQRVLDFLLSSLSRDITGYSEDELQGILAEAGKYLAVANERLLIDFLGYLNRKKLVRIDWEYEAEGKRVVKRENGAYRLEDFALMAYTVFNPEAWEDHCLLEKAAWSQRYADMWLFVSLHFFCGLRSSDMEALPVPELPWPGPELRQRILDGKFKGEEASAFAEHWVYLTGLVGKRPRKTSMHTGIPEIKFFIPESLLEPEGIILGMALSHHREGEPCVRPGAEKAQLASFFGKRFAAAAGRRRFETRRANKAYLQGIEATADPVPGRAKGYMLAALARSHKGGIGTLPEMTDIYLKDAAFSGYTPDFILREMFERGIFGFIPAMLMEAYRGEDFRRLGVSGQTLLIRSFGLTAGELEGIAGSVQHSIEKAKNAVEELFSDGGGIRERTFRVLRNIAADSVPAKQDGMMCLCMASGHLCRYPDRSCCLGCGYEVYTKSAFHLLMQEYAVLIQKRNISEGRARERYTRLVEEGILPAAAQILESIPLLYPDADMEPMLEMLERGIAYAAACK